MIKRALYINLWKKLSVEKQMVFLSGARQTGKTTLAKEIAKGFANSSYINWDFPEHKKLILKSPGFFENINRKDGSMPLVILDEIHKYKRWKNYLKGIYDEYSQDYKFLVSGSGRLDLYQKGGDSLAGRYFQFHLFPFTVAELGGRNRDFKGFMKSPLELDTGGSKETREAWNGLLDVGGFPEPFVKGKKDFYTRWIRNYTAQIVREDIRNMHDVRNVDTIELLSALLPSKVGSPLSMNNLAEELQVSFGSIKEWLKLFEVFYLVFRISPWTKKISRAIRKEKKLYIYNYPEIENEGYRFENMVGVELARAVQNWNEYGYGRFTLHYIRNRQKEEADFLIADSNNPVLLIETKFSDDMPAKSLVNFQNTLNVPAVQLVNRDNIFKHIKNGKNKILIATAHRWLSLLP